MISESSTRPTFTFVARLGQDSNEDFSVIGIGMRVGTGTGTETGAGTRTRTGIGVGLDIDIDIGVGVGIGIGVGVADQIRVPEEGKMKVVGNRESVSSITRALWIGASG